MANFFTGNWDPVPLGGFTNRCPDAIDKKEFNTSRTYRNEYLYEIFIILVFTQKVSYQYKKMMYYSKLKIHRYDTE